MQPPTVPRPRRGTAVLAALALLAPGIGVQARTDFSADTLLRSAQGQTIPGHMVVSRGRVRVDYQADGQAVVRINDPTNQQIWTLFPERRQFMVQAAPHGALAPGLSGRRGTDVNPCDTFPDSRCERIGEESIDDRAAIHWRITTTHGDRQRVHDQWIDAERGFALRHDFGNGDGGSLTLLGHETVDGRAVEKWQLAQRRGDQVRTELQWYDPELETTIRETRTDGSARTLTHIQVGPQDETLFQIPGGYTQVQVPAGDGR